MTYRLPGGVKVDSHARGHTYTVPVDLTGSRLVVSIFMNIAFLNVPVSIRVIG